MKRSIRKTVVLTSTENFVWSSMQEIIPAIEDAWLMSARKKLHDVQVIDVGLQPLSSYVEKLLDADLIVFTCFTVKLARLGEVFRKHLQLKARYAVYLHNQATIACWPYFAWGFGEVLRTSDVFISSSSYDARALRLTFPRGDVRVFPFTILETEIRGFRKPRTPEIRFVYAGRISSQKNVHTLIAAFAEYSGKCPGESRARLILFGGEDGLGSPNMGVRDKNYQSSLKKLARSLGVGSLVEFRGHLTRKRLHDELRDPHIFVSASLHSDENFGMSALRSLCMGAPAVLSCWGGHADFETAFPAQTVLVGVKSSGAGPSVSVSSFADGLERAVRLQRRRKARVPAAYKPATVARALRTLALEKTTSEDRVLAPSRLAQAVLAKRRHFLKTSPTGTKIFESYSDPLSHPFFAAYGMRGSRAHSLPVKR